VYNVKSKDYYEFNIIFNILANNLDVTFAIIFRAWMCNRQLTGLLYVSISQQGKKITKIPYVLYNSSPVNIMEINLNVCMQAFCLLFVPELINTQSTGNKMPNS